MQGGGASDADAGQAALQYMDNATFVWEHMFRLPANCKPSNAAGDTMPLHMPVAVRPLSALTLWAACREGRGWQVEG